MTSKRLNCHVDSTTKKQQLTLVNKGSTQQWN